MPRRGPCLSLAFTFALSAPGILWALDAGALCDRAAVQAARDTGVPLETLLALTRTETGRGRPGATRPWPWAVNRGGQGAWFATRADAAEAVAQALEGGETNIDIGCFQLNYRWHGDAFATVDAMFDPLPNARYAARFLLSLYSETGDWRSAAGAFHSRRPAEAAAYLDRFDSVLAGLSEITPDAGLATLHAAQRINAFPLLTAGAPGVPGSLVPLARSRPGLLASAGRPLIGP